MMRRSRDAFARDLPSFNGWGYAIVRAVLRAWPWLYHELGLDYSPSGLPCLCSRCVKSRQQKD